MPGLGAVTYDIAFGGNFYAIVDAASAGLAVDPARADELVEAGLAVMGAVEPPVHPADTRIAGCRHVIFTEPGRDGAHARAATSIHPGWLDRSPCGTGTSARMAQLHARGALALGAPFVNESVIGTRFTGRLVAETDGRRAPGGGARDHRPGVGHRHGAVRPRRGRPLPGRLRVVSDAGFAGRARSAATISTGHAVSDRCEVAVVGAGIVGAACARELAVRGVDVCLLDRGAVAGGTTGLGEGNVLCSDKDAGPELELTRLGLRVYDELDARLGAEARIRRKGALIVHPDADTWAAEPARVGRLQAAGVRAELLDPGAVRAREPQLTGPLHGASFFPADLQCDPRAIARALAREAQAAGARVLPGRDAGAIAIRGGRVTGVDGLAAAAVVLAAGPWSAALAGAAGLALPVEPRKGQLVRLAAPPGEPRFFRHKVVDGGYLASVASADAALQVTTVLETDWEGRVLVGSSRERRGFDAGVDPAVGAAILARARRLAPGLAALAPDAQWAGLRPWLPDHRPAIGPSRALPGLWAATGHEGAGVALGPVTGRLLAQAYCGEAPELDLAPFDPDRFAA